MPIITLTPTLQIQTDNLDSIVVSNSDNTVHIFYKSSPEAKVIDCSRHGGVDYVSYYIERAGLFGPPEPEQPPYFMIESTLDASNEIKPKRRNSLTSILSLFSSSSGSL